MTATRGVRLAVVLCTFLPLGCRSPAGPAPAGASRVERLEADLARGEGAPFALRIALASACLDVVDDPRVSEAQKLRYARRALEHADAAIRLEPERVEGHYYRAVSLGQVLDHSTLPNLGLIGELEAAGIRARELDPGYADAGPLRLLALLYQKAPAWPIGPELAGETEVIEELFAEAIERAPGSVENRLAYAEFLHEEGRREDARKSALRAKELLDARGDRGAETESLRRRLRELLAALDS
ncbi:MAG: hypothetical protein D6731_16785 [Planctomycetota bacterium]|nr:MAG: hypothetical protein D6731_16785 [Planctomycetota bacterium]